jgi:hypothetical protein
LNVLGDPYVPARRHPTIPGRNDSTRRWNV